MSSPRGVDLARENGETHTNFHPDAGGDDRVRRKFPALPIGAEANQHRRS